MFVKTPAFDELSFALISSVANQSGVLNSLTNGGLQKFARGFRKVLSSSNTPCLFIITDRKDENELQFPR